MQAGNRQDRDDDQRLDQVPAISAKSEDIQQAFFNVVRNGVQAMDCAGKLAIQSFCKEDRVTVRISDNGAGITPDNLAKICDPFFTTKGPDEGEGIGLFVVRQIVDKYGGDMEFESEVGQGTVCEIAFPVRDAGKETP